MTSKARTLSRVVTGDRLANTIVDAVNTAVIQTNLPAFQGDVTSSAGGNTLTLATSGVTAGSYGNTTAIPVITVDAKGRITAATTNSVSGVTGVTWTAANSTVTVSTSTVAFSANIQSANATVQGLVTVLDSVANTSTVIAASANSAKNAYDRAIDANTRASSAQTAATSAYTNAVAYAASNSYVNTTFAPKAGPTFTGTAAFADVTISGNLTTSGTTTYINTTNLTVGDNIITLNADLGASAPSENAGIEVNRGTSANVALRWYEASDVWQTTVDGTNYLNLATNNDVSTAYSNAIAYSGNAALAYANAIAYAAANSYVNTQLGLKANLSGATFSGAVSGITTLAAGNTTITGFANVSSTLNVVGRISTSNTILANTDLFDPSGGGNWMNAALVLKGGYGGGLAFHDAPTGVGSNSFVIWSQTSGTELRFGSANTTTATSTILTLGKTGAVTFGGAVSGITTLAAGNTTITGFANVTSTLQVGGTSTFTGLITGTITSANNADYLDGQHGAYYAANSQLASYALLSGATYSGAVSGITTLAAGNTNITGFANVSAHVQATAPTIQTAITSVSALSAPYRVTDSNVGSTAGFAAGYGQTTIYNSGYRSHMVLGSYRTASGWGGGPFISWGGNDNSSTEYWLFNYGGSITHSNGNTFVTTTFSSPVAISNTFAAGNTTITGHALPGSDATYNLGSASYRWNNIYTADAHFSNEGTEGNSVDGTTGNWTLQEGEVNIYMLNNKTGKRYKIKMEEV